MPPRTRAKTAATITKKAKSIDKQKTKPTRAKLKSRRLRKKEIESICSNLKDLDIEELRMDLVRQINSGYHLLFFEDRLKVWEYITSANVEELDSLLCVLLDAFVEKYRQNFKGKDRHERLLLNWYEYMQLYTTKESEVGATVWNQLTKGWGDTEGISDQTQSSLMSSLLMGSLNELLKRVECSLSDEEASEWLPSAEGYHPDDETSLYRLGGFALFSAIRFRHKKLMWRRKLGVSKEAAQKYRTEHLLLQQMKDVEKSDLPSAVHIQDRGGMTFMSPKLLPFVRNCVAEIRRLMNYQEYSEHGKGFFKHIREHLPMDSLTQKFKQLVDTFVLGVPEDAALASLGQELVLKICHTMSNDFLRNVRTLEQLKEKKAVDVHMSLRDELKSFALHKESEFATNDLVKLCQHYTHTCSEVLR